jgi:hypothetical protein
MKVIVELQMTLEIASFFLSREINDNYELCNGWIASLVPMNKWNIE